MEEYTIRRHVQRLEGMLQQEAPCACCPAYRRFDLNSVPIRAAAQFNHNFNSEFVNRAVCMICRDFVGLSKHGHGCPCKVLGEGTALTKTVAALKKYHEEQES